MKAFKNYFQTLFLKGMLSLIESEIMQCYGRVEKNDRFCEGLRFFSFFFTLPLSSDILSCWQIQSQITYNSDYIEFQLYCRSQCWRNIGLIEMYGSVVRKKVTDFAQVCEYFASLYSLRTETDLPTCSRRSNSSVTPEMFYLPIYSGASYFARPSSYIPHFECQNNEIIVKNCARCEKVHL